MHHMPGLYCQHQMHTHTPGRAVFLLLFNFSIVGKLLLAETFDLKSIIILCWIFCIFLFLASICIRNRMHLFACWAACKQLFNTLQRFQLLSLSLLPSFPLSVPLSLVSLPSHFHLSPPFSNRLD